MFTFLLLWIIFGWLCAHYIEEMDWIESFYFVISTVSTCGNVVPRCVGPDKYSCNLGNRAYLWAAYILVGVPLFAACMGYVCMVVVQTAVKK